ncbi:DUF397 domain-containing protein [Actinomadura sp. 1N219]|uniref:DUF397 domain-containing protein n=1 Tax=Actinomadura sp. 1N219 TaxID=3375152 RepID=UPI0037AD6E71
MNRTLQWRKSTYSGSVGESDCVELADLAPAVGVRDSKDPGGPRLVLGRAQFAEFISQIKAGQRGR